MPELPEIHNLAGQIDRALKGAVIVKTEIREPKCLNRPVDEWSGLILERELLGAVSHGKWCEMKLAGGVKLRLNLGMGGEFLLHEAGEAPPEKRRMILNLADGRSVSVNFWWFGSLHAVKEGEEHKPFDSLGTDALDNALDEEAFRKMYCTRKAAIKTLLMDQKLAAGVGNYYSHDIFFEARLHPLKRACDLTEEEYSRLYHTMRNTFIEASEMGGADYERDLYNRLGRWSRRLVAYRKGEKCPVCGSVIEEIRTGSTSGCICPQCQKL